MANNVRWNNYTIRSAVSLLNDKSLLYVLFEKNRLESPRQKKINYDQLFGETVLHKNKNSSVG
jgi:hypothetical protein